MRAVDFGKTKAETRRREGYGEGEVSSGIFRKADQTSLQKDKKGVDTRGAWDKIQWPN